MPGPFLRRWNLGPGEHIPKLLPPEQPALVHERPKIGRNRHIRRCRDDSVPQSMAGLGNIEQNPPESRLRRLLLALRHRQPLGHRHGFRRRNPSRPSQRAVCHKGLQPLGQRWLDTAIRLPLLPLGNAQAGTQIVHLARVHQAGMIVLVAGKWQAIALDRIGDEHRRPVIIGLLESLDQRLHAMAAKIEHERRKSCIIKAFNQLANRRIAADIGDETRPPGRAALVGQRRIFSVGAAVDPVRQRMAAGALEHFALQFAVLECQHAPATGLENIVEAPEHPVRRGAVQRLAVEVDNPPAIANIVLVALDQALVDIALIKLGIAHQRDHPARISLGHLAMGDQVILHQAGKRRDGDAETHGTG